MGQVIPFGSKNQDPPPPEGPDEDYLWTCTECESTALHCYTDGRVECSSCGSFIHDLRTFEP